MENENLTHKQPAIESAPPVEVVVDTGDQQGELVSAAVFAPIDSVNSPGELSTEPRVDVDSASSPTSTSVAGLPEQKTTLDRVTDKIRGHSISLPVDNPLPQDAQLAESVAHPSHSGSDGDSSDKENSRKRKLSSRSSVATETAARQHLKRPKETDVIEREEDVEEDQVSEPVAKGSPKPTQVFGFGSFASATSPFVSAPNSSPGPSLKPNSATVSTTLEERRNSAVDESEVPDTSSKVRPPPTPKKPIDGFAAFAVASSLRSPGSSVPLSDNINPASPPRPSLAGPVRRSKSPVGKHQAFGQYSTGISRFGSPALRKPVHDESSHQPSDGDKAEKGATPDFEDILKAKGDETPTINSNVAKPEIQQVQYNTGEEEDVTVFQTRAKLYTQDENFAYKERGTGLIKVNVRRRDGEGARIVMRAEGVLRLLLNMALYPGLIYELGPDPKFVKVAEITSTERKFHAIKVGSAKLAQELYDHLSDNVPTQSSTPPV